MAHLAVVHVKGELPAYQRKVIEGETPLKLVKAAGKNGNGNGKKLHKLHA